MTSKESQSVPQGGPGQVSTPQEEPALDRPGRPGWSTLAMPRCGLGRAQEGRGLSMNASIWEMTAAGDWLGARVLGLEPESTAY